MKQLRKRIASIITAAAVAFSAVTLPDMGILPNLAIKASAENVSLQTDNEIAAGTAGHYYVNMPSSGSSTLTLTEQDITDGKGTFKVYDDGGKNGNYSKLEGNNVTLTISVPEGYVLRFSGSIITYATSTEFISIYAGSGTDGMILANKVTGKSSTPINDAICLNQSITIYFQSGRGSSSAAGFDLTVECIDNRNKTYDAPEWLAVDPTKDAGTEGYYYVNIPAATDNRTLECEIPDGFEQSFQVKFCNPEGEAQGTINLTAPTGRKMIYSGSYVGAGSNTYSRYVIKHNETEKYSGNSNGTIPETTTGSNNLNAYCYAWCGAAYGNLTLNVRMKSDPIRVSNLGEFYAHTGNTINVVPTVTDADNNTTLVNGTDYDVTFSPAVVKDKGVYTATINGKGNYSFTKSFNFLVGTLEYIDENGETQAKPQDELTILSNRDELPATLTGWYLVADNISFSSVVEVSGTAHLILADGTTMNANRIRVNSGNTLNIYGQTGGTGKLTVSPSGVVSNDAGIGASKGNNCGTIIINGGDVTASAGTLSGSAAIGASLSNSCGTIIINGGKVTATGNNSVANIGGSSGSVTINGGQVTANTNGIGGTTVSLGWRDAENDFIQATSYSGTVSFQEEKPFILDDGTNIDATADNIGGKKIVPKHGTITYNLDYATISGIEKAYAPNDAGIGLQYSVAYTGNTPLQEGTDYTVAITDSNNQTVDVVKTAGVYTLTITGMGSYTGTKTAKITVYGFKETLGGYEFSTSGDADGLYYIVDSEDALRAIATYVNAGNNCDGKTFKQTQPITLSGNFTPIGASGKPFSGTYDGDGKTISGLSISTNYSSIGLFGVTRGSIKNVVLVSPSFTATVENETYSVNIGAVAGMCNGQTTIENCYVSSPSVSVKLSTSNIGVFVGQEWDGTLTIKDCYYYGSSLNAVGDNSGATCIPSNVERVYRITTNDCTVTATPTISVDGIDYYTSGTAATVTATVPSTGMKKFTITGTTASLTETLGQYTLTVPTNDVTVSLDDFTPTITVAEGSTYTGTAQTPAVTVKDGDTALTADTDYTNVSYTNNINAGTDTASVSITGKGFYLGSATQTFSIAKATITPAVSIDGWTYGDAANEPSVTAESNPGNGAVTYEYKVKGADDDTYSADAPTDAGEYTVRATIAETDNYASGTATADFTITAKSVTIPTAVTGLKWTGSEQTGVAEGDGYTVTDGAATAVGDYTATATLTSTTNYKWSDDTTEAKSIAWNMGKADGPAAPTGLAGVAPTTEDDSDGKITGVDTTMEYSTDGTTYTACTGTEITDLAAGTYSVRTATTATHEAGAAAEVEVPAYVAQTYIVTVTAGANMTKTSGDESQSITSGSAMTSVVYTANDGYYFPTDYSVETVNGITVTRNSYSQITVSGTPTAAASVTLTAPTAKTKPAVPTTPSATDCTTAENNGGTITGITADMEYKKSDAAEWTSGTGSDITGLSNGTYYVRIKATDTALASDNQMLTIAAYTPEGQVAAPTFTPPAGSYIGTQSVTISCATDGATIYYTTDGTDPTSSSAVYSTAIAVSETTTIKAIAVKAEMTDSSVSEATYTITAATYTLSVTAPTFDAVSVGYAQPAAKAVTITSTGNSNATISSVALSGSNSDSFTLTNGTASVTAGSTNTSYTIRPNAGLTAGTYTATITVTYNDGATATANISFTVNALDVVATPTFDPVGGTYSSAQSVTISCGTSGATIYYTTDGTTPTTSSTVYSSAIAVSATTTIKAIAVKTEMTNSAVATATYTINTSATVATPTFSPAGGTYTSVQNVTISCGTSGATIYYTTDGSTPTTSSSVYSSAIAVSATTTIKAIAVKAGILRKIP